MSDLRKEFEEKVCSACYRKSDKEKDKRISTLESIGKEMLERLVMRKDELFKLGWDSFSMSNKYEYEYLKDIITKAEEIFKEK